MNIQRAKLITCIVPYEKGSELLARLKEDKGITTANLHHCRGAGAVVQASDRDPQMHEKDLVTIVVSEDKSEEIFEYIYCQSGIGEPHGGFMYQTRLTGSIEYLLPQNIQEET